MEFTATKGSSMKTFGDLSNIELSEIAADLDRNPGGAATASAVLRQRGLAVAGTIAEGKSFIWNDAMYRVSGFDSAGRVVTEKLGGPRTVLFNPTTLIHYPHSVPVRS